MFIISRKKCQRIKKPQSEPQSKHRKRAVKEPPLPEPLSASSMMDPSSSYESKTFQQIPVTSYTLGTTSQLQELTECILVILKDREVPQSLEEGTSCSEILNAEVVGNDNELGHNLPNNAKIILRMGNMLIWHL